MTSSPAVSSFFSPPQDHLSALGSHSSKNLEWPQTHELGKNLLDGHDGLESLSQERTPPKDSAQTPSGRRPSSGVQKFTYSTTPLAVHQQGNDSLNSNPKSAAPEDPYVRDNANDDGITAFRRISNRWSFNGSEKLVDPRASWDLVDEIGKLKISNGGSDRTDGSTTPPKAAARDVLQIQETSPLDTSSSDTSLDSSSPQNEDALNLPSHSRGSSTDTLSSESSAHSQALFNTLKSTSFTTDLTKDRPRSFSGALSDIELRRLQNIATPSQLPESLQDRDASPMTRDTNSTESKPPSTTASGENIGGTVQPMYPSLSSYPSVQHPQIPGLASQGFVHGLASRPDELHVDPSFQSRQFVNHAQAPAPFNQMQTASGPIRHGQQGSLDYRQQIRGVNMYQPPAQVAPQGPLLPSPTNFINAYSAVPNAHGHHNHLSLGNSQQMYELMIPPVDPAINRAQQTFRAGHQHSASDPASLRDAALLLMQGYQATPSMYQPMPLPTPPVFPSQFFPGPAPQPQTVYNQEISGALARGMPQYNANSQQAQAPPTPASVQTTSSYTTINSSPTPSAGGPSANNRKLGLYKTELCRSWEEKGTCRYGPKCQFAHGEEEIRKVARHPKYKTEICRTFWVSGSCPYGKRCCFIHTELPQQGTPPGGAQGSDSNPTPPAADGRARSMSTNSEPEVQISLLQRIGAKRNAESNSANTTTPTATNPPEGSNYHFTKPPSGALRVDTNVLDNVVAAAKQNKSAYPTFANNNNLQALSPGPVTAGPEFGRHGGPVNTGSIDINQRMASVGQGHSNPRHSYNGSEASINFNQSRNVSGGSSPFAIVPNESPSSGTPGGHGHGHSRSGSSGNWGSFSQKNSLSTPTSYAHTPSPANDLGGVNALSSPWGAPDLNSTTNTARLNDRTWS